MPVTEIFKEGGMWVFNIDGKHHTTGQAAEFFGIEKATLAGRMCKKKTDANNIGEWIDDYLWKRKNGIRGGKGKVYKNPEGCKCAVSIIVKLTGRNKACVLEHIRKWENGLMDTDQLCWPEGVPVPKHIQKRNNRKGKRGNKEWRKLGKEKSIKNTKRKNKVELIPLPTNIDIKLSGASECGIPTMNVIPEKTVII